MIEKKDWEVFAANMLKAELMCKGVTYAQLAELIGEREVNVRNKLGRGNIQASFLLQCLSAIGSHELKFQVFSPELPPNSWTDFRLI